MLLCSASHVALFVWNAICKVAVAQQRLPMNSIQQLLLNNGWLKGQYVANFQPWAAADVSLETNVLSGKKKGVLSYTVTVTASTRSCVFVFEFYYCSTYACMPVLVYTCTVEWLQQLSQKAEGLLSSVKWFLHICTCTCIMLISCSLRDSEGIASPTLLIQKASAGPKYQCVRPGVNDRADKSSCVQDVRLPAHALPPAQGCYNTQLSQAQSLRF